MILIKRDILKAIDAGDVEIDPFLPEHVGPNSVDLHLDNTLLCSTFATYDARKPAEMYQKTIFPYGLCLDPGVLYIGRTVERTFTPKHVPYIGGRSSVGRLGVMVHCTAGFGDIGFNGTWTLEISVVQPVRIYPDMRICQLWLFEPSSQPNARDMYQGRYQGQRAATPSRFHEPDPDVVEDCDCEEET